MSVTITKKAASEFTAAGAKPKVMGVDPSSTTGIVVLHGDFRLCADVLRAPEGVIGYRRLHLIANLVRAVAEQYDVDFLFIERPITSGKFNNEFQAQVGTAIRLGLHQNGIGWYDVSPTTLKKWTAGSGRADKKQMMQAVTSRWGFTTKDDNEADAYALARLGQHVLSNSLLGTFKGVNCGNS